MTGQDHGCTPAIPKPGRLAKISVLGRMVDAAPGTIAASVLARRQGHRP